MVKLKLRFMMYVVAMLYAIGTGLNVGFKVAGDGASLYADLSAALEEELNERPTKVSA